MLHKIPRADKNASLGALFLLYVYWAPYLAMGSFMLYANVAGTTKKLVTFSLSYIGYCTGKGTQRIAIADKLATSLRRRPSSLGKPLPIQRPLL